MSTPSSKMENQHPVSTPKRVVSSSVRPTPSSSSIRALSDESRLAIIKARNIYAPQRGPPNFNLQGGQVPQNLNSSASRVNGQDPFSNGVSLLTRNGKTLQLAPGAVQFTPRKLSATAIPFTPQKLSATAAPFAPQKPISVASSTETIKSTPRGSISETPGTSSKPKKKREWRNPGKSSKASGKTLSGTSYRHLKTEGIFNYVYPVGQFADTVHTRYIKVTKIPLDLKTSTVRRRLTGTTYGVPDAAIHTKRSEGMFILAFADIVDAVNAAGEIPNNNATWSTDFINAREFAEYLAPRGSTAISAYKGQLEVGAFRQGPYSEFVVDDIEKSMLEMVKNHGSILAWQILDTTYPWVRVRMEYYNINNCDKAKAALDGIVYGPLWFSVKDYSPDVMQPPSITVHHEPPVVSAQEEEYRAMVDKLTFDNMFSKSPQLSALPMAGNPSASLPTGGSSNTGPATTVPTAYFREPSSRYGYYEYSTKPFSGLTRDHIGYAPATPTVVGPNAYTPASSTVGYGNYVPPMSYAPTPARTVTGSNAFTPASSTVNYGEYVTPMTTALHAPIVTPMAQYGRYAVAYDRGVQDYKGDFHGRRAARIVHPGNNNVVNLIRIAHGQDVRTTIMLRNIPNRMHQSELKKLVDQSNLGEYDFMYLRIDFANNCNVGYAFINFVDPLAIVKFVRARAGMKWPRWHSEKQAEISYATIQGRDCLIQKFRNSSIMLEDTSFRPKLFYTGNSPKAGEEEPFPPSDNDSKLRRSIENAGTVGLFAPRAGQRFRESQRRRRSQYDRGTHLAQIEESCFSSIHEHAVYVSSGPYYGPVAGCANFPQSGRLKY